MKFTSSALIGAVFALLVAMAAACTSGGSTLPSGPLGTGPYQVATTTVASGNGFAGGTIYTPEWGGPSAGPYGAFVIVPGFLSAQSSVAWYGPLLASQGFVVLTIDTNSPTDDPSARSIQQEAALNYLKDSSPVRNKVDPNRMVAAGWSMGGGGSLRTAARMPNLKAVVTLAGWEPGFNVSSINQPTLVVACQNDIIAPNDGDSYRFFSEIPAKEKAIIEITGGDHFCVTTTNADIAKALIPWAKVFVDGDAWYGWYLCPGPSGSGISKYQATCPIP